jgi:O-methyltransferase
MLKGIARRVLRPLRKAAGRFVILPEANEGSFVGEHGCLRAAASFVAWNQIEGDYLEFGVFKGESFAVAYRAIQRNRDLHAVITRSSSPEYRRWLERRPRFFAFDSFEGLPGGGGERHVDYGVGSYACTEAQFRQNVTARGVKPEDLVVVPGFYDESLTPEVKRRHQLSRAAVVMIDCDLYESTVPVLRFLTDIVGQGTVLIFDDWFRFKGSPQSGEQRAAREWVEANPHLELIEYWREGPQAVSFLVNLKESVRPTSHIDE